MEVHLLLVLANAEIKMNSVDFYVRTTKDFSSIPKGSGLHIHKESDRFYYGTWSSMLGSSIIKVPKDLCVKLEKDVWLTNFPV